MISKKIGNLVTGVLNIEGDVITILNETSLRNELIYDLVWEAVFGLEQDKKSARWVIWECALALGIVPSSINDFYMARGREELPLNFTVPAINIRALTFDFAETLFSVAKELKVGSLICEIARSEMGYTQQSPEEYAIVVMAGAIKAGWDAPIFIQGDHMQTKAVTPGVPKGGEVEIIKELISEIIAAGFYNIDIDTSTLVDLNKPTVEEQQESNIKYSVEFAKYIRDHEPKDITISVGGEIGHIGGKNSTVEDFDVYVSGFKKGLPTNMIGISKISIQTGTSHGGVVLADGTLAKIDVDFDVLAKVSKACRELHKISGAVQHGASTLTDDFYSHFPKTETAEIHLATGFQNMLLDHPNFPADLLEKMYAWVDETKISERKEDWTDEQFHYKLRKKSIGHFKKEMWAMDLQNKMAIKDTLAKRFKFLFTELNVINTATLISQFIVPVKIHKKVEDFGKPTVTNTNVVGLSD